MKALCRRKVKLFFLCRIMYNDEVTAHIISKAFYEHKMPVYDYMLQKDKNDEKRRMT